MANIIYRETRNILRSAIDEIKEILSENDWDNVNVVRGFNELYDLPFDADKKTAAISVRVSYTIYDDAELGSNAKIRKPLILLDICGSSSGQKEDVCDCLAKELKKGFDYYEYILKDGSVNSKVKNGRIVVNTMSETPINLDMDKDQLNPWDRYRSLITLSCIKSSIEP